MLPISVFVADNCRLGVHSPFLDLNTMTIANVSRRFVTCLISFQLQRVRRKWRTVWFWRECYNEGRASRAGPAWIVQYPVAAPRISKWIVQYPVAALIYSYHRDSTDLLGLLIPFRAMLVRAWLPCEWPFNNRSYTITRTTPENQSSRRLFYKHKCVWEIANWS